MKWQEEWWFLRERLGGPSSRRAVRKETSKLLMAHFAVEGTAQFGAMCFSNVFYWIVFQLNVFRWSVFQCSGFLRRPRCPALPAASFPPLIAPALHQSNPIQCSAFHKSNTTQGFTPIQHSTSHQSNPVLFTNPIQCFTPIQYCRLFNNLHFFAFVFTSDFSVALNCNRNVFVFNCNSFFLLPKLKDIHQGVHQLFCNIMQAT